MIYLSGDGTASRLRVHLYLVDATDGITPELGEAGGQPQLSKNGAAFANTTNLLVSLGNGAYYVELTASEVNTAGHLFVRYKSANTAECQVAGTVISPSLFGSTFVDANVVRWSGTAIAASTPGIPNVNLVAWNNSAPNNLVSGRVDASVGALAAGIVTSIQAGLATSASITALQSSVDALQYLLQGNALIDNTVHGVNGTTSARLRGFSSAVSADAATDGAADGAEGEVARWTITTTYDGVGQIATHKLIRTL
jgi:hypothetical protein